MTDRSEPTTAAGFDIRHLTDDQRSLADDIASAMAFGHEDSCAVWWEDPDGCSCPLLADVASGLIGARIVEVTQEWGYDPATQRGDRLKRQTFNPHPLAPAPQVLDTGLQPSSRRLPIEAVSRQSDRGNRISQVEALRAALVDGMAYALARADLPSSTETSRDYAERLAPLVAESGFLQASPPPESRAPEAGRALSQAEPHPEDFCGRCGGANPTWHAASPLWNAVMRTTDREPFDGIICPSCFAVLAAEAGVTGRICVTAHSGDVSVALASTFGDGRVWDAAQCRWMDPAPPAPALAQPSASIDVERMAEAIKAARKGWKMFDGCGNGGAKGSCKGHDTSEADAKVIAAEYARLTRQSSEGSER